MWLVGMDIGGTKSAAILGKAKGEEIEVVGRSEFPTEPPKGWEQTLSRLVTEAKALLQHNSVDMDSVGGIGVSCGGPLDSRRGLVLSPPNLPGWDNVPVVEFFRDKLKAPTLLQNDANACALAEWRWGAGRGARNMIFLTFGTGLGAGLILDGRLYSGTNDLAGEVGHVRLDPDGPVGFGKAGSFEGYCSGGGIAQLAQKMARQAWDRGETVSFCNDETALDSLTTRAVADAANSGDALAIEVFRVSGEHLGRGLAVLVDILNPETIVIGSIFARQRDLLWPHAEKTLRAEALGPALEVCRVVPAELGEAVGDYAALAVGMEAAP